MKYRKFDEMIVLNSKIYRIVFAAVASFVVNLAWQNVWRVTSLLDIPSQTVFTSSVRDLLMALTVFIVLAIVVNPKEACSFLGLKSNFVKGFLVAIISVLPLYIVFPFIGTINPDLTFPLLVRKSFLPGFIEELLCRAFMFGLFFRYAKTGFFWATLLPAILFGLAHTYQGHDIVSSLAAFGVTFIGAVYFSWMYAAWNFNLWVPIGLHILMNAAWVIFDVAGTEVAAGGLNSNIVRVFSIVLAIIITVYFHKKKGEKVFDYPIWKF